MICIYLLVLIMIKKNYNDIVNKYKILYVENMGKCNGL